MSTRLLCGPDGSAPRTERRPGAWCTGLVLNLVLSLLYLHVEPLSAVPHRDWAVLVGSYFAAFLLADSATTNALGTDAGRVTRRLRAGTSLRRILLTKNLVLMLVVALPVLTTTALITVEHEAASRLVLTIPAVLGTVLAWLGLGNVVSVLVPVSPVPLGIRWRQRRDLVATGRWLAVGALPYALCAVIDPLTQVPTLVFRLFRFGADTSIAVPAVVLLATGLATYGGLTAAALRLACLRPPPFLERPTQSVEIQAGSPAMALVA